MTVFNILNLFSGHQTWLPDWKYNDHVIRTVELNPKLAADLHADVAELSSDDLLSLFTMHTWIEGSIDVVIASLPCETFSVASIGHHWTKGPNGELYVPKTEAARRAIRLAKHTVKLIQEIDPTYFWIENPRGVLRKLGIIPPEWDHATVWYCRYGDERAKPTDLWGRWPEAFVPRPPCKNGASLRGECHHAVARRGAKTGTQGRKGAAERSLIPRELAREVYESCQL